MQFEPADSADLAQVEEQLGRRPTAVVGVAARCPAGHVSVVVSHPLHRVGGTVGTAGTAGTGGRVEPFPTLYWLTCPALTRALSRLEMGGLIAELDRRLRADAGLSAGLRRNHADYVAERWSILDPAEQAEVHTAGLAGVLGKRGIGGLGNWQSVKCLHLHYAHHLARENVIGALLTDEFGVQPCPAGA